MMGIYPSSLPSLLRTPSLNLLPPTLLQLVLPDTDTPATSEDPFSSHIRQSFVPIATRSMTEQEAVHQSVQERQLSPSTSSSPATMMWPLLEEYPSMRSPPRATSPVHFPHSSLLVREISQGNARIRLPLATISSI